MRRRAFITQPRGRSRCCASIAAHGVVKPAVLDEAGTVLSEGPCANHAPSRGHSMPLPGVLHCARALA
jgi:hypothetical protein